MKLAGIPPAWRRLAAKILDQLVVGVFYLPLWWIGLRNFSQETISIHWILFMVLAVLPLIFETLFLYLWGQTPGKWIMDLAVVMRTGNKPDLSFSICLLRSLVNQLSFFFGLAPQLTMFFRYDRTHIADWLAGTRVIDLLHPVRKTKKRILFATIAITFFLVTQWELSQSYVQEIVFEGTRVQIPNPIPRVHIR